ncbi:MAG: hypothetical protein HQK83_12375, partial [Fibrobacteria bacterium]|nr:hypothetical protein [Fibrobacteria bacterium]
GLTKIAASYQGPMSWTGRLVFSAGRFADQTNLFGIQPLAKKNSGEANLAEPPKMGSHVSLFFTGQEETQSSVRFATDFRTSFNPKEEWWEFGVSGQQTGVKLAKLSVDGLDQLYESGLYTFIVDRGVAWNLANGDSIEIPTPSKERFYQLVVTDDANFAEKLAMKFKLAQNVPNPVRFGTTFNFHLPWRFDAQGRRVTTDYKLSISMYDARGRKVAVILENRYQPGTYSHFWRRSVRIPSGTYFYMLKAGIFKASKKIVILR